MRFVPVKSEETQGAAMVFRVRELLIRQRTQAINALRGHLGVCAVSAPLRFRLQADFPARLVKVQNELTGKSRVSSL